MEEEEIRRLSEVVGDETYNGGSVEEKRERKERGGEREKSRTCNPISVRASRKAPLTGFGSHTHTHNTIVLVW